MKNIIKLFKAFLNYFTSVKILTLGLGSTILSYLIPTKLVPYTKFFFKILTKFFRYSRNILSLTALITTLNIIDFTMNIYNIYDFIKKFFKNSIKKFNFFSII